MDCYSCSKGTPLEGPKVCPECNHVFKGKGWEGLDAHWKAKHESVMPYEQLWGSFCQSHRHSQGNNENAFVRIMNGDNNAFQRIGSQSNAHVGRDFESAAMSFFSSQGLALQPNIKVPVGIEGKQKLHAFDLGCEEQKVIVECKSHRWTTGDNVPSAKMTVWNEAMYYFLAAPNGYRKIMFVLKDYSSKRGETLAEYYLRTYEHLVPADVEIWEYDEKTKGGLRLSKGRCE